MLTSGECRARGRCSFLRRSWRKAWSRRWTTNLSVPSKTFSNSENEDDKLEEGRLRIWQGNSKLKYFSFLQFENFSATLRGTDFGKVTHAFPFLSIRKSERRKKKDLLKLYQSSWRKASSFLFENIFSSSILPMSSYKAGSNVQF